MTAARRQTLLRRLFWGILLLLLGLSTFGILGFLWPARVSQASPVGIIWSGRAWESTVGLARQGDYWVGKVAHFPLASATHVRPQGSPGFHLVRYADGRFAAFTDRNTRTLGRLIWQDPLPRGWGWSSAPDAAGFYDPRCGYMWDANGDPISGGPKWPLPYFELRVEGDRVFVSVRPNHDSIHRAWGTSYTSS